MNIYGWEPTESQLWLLGIVAWLVTTVVTFFVGRLSAGSDRYHQAADRFRTGVNALAHNAPEPTSHSFLTGPYQSDKVGEFIKDLQRQVDDFAPFLKPRREEAMREYTKAVIAYAHVAHAQPRDAFKRGGSDQRQKLSGMTKRLVDCAPERRAWF